MRYTLVWCSKQSAFHLTHPDASVRSVSEAELRQEWAGNDVLLAWLEFTKAHPGRPVDFDPLPPAQVA